MNRCIQCYRCVRFYRDYAGGRDFNVFGAHDHVYFGRPRTAPLKASSAAIWWKYAPPASSPTRPSRPITAANGICRPRPPSAYTAGWAATPSPASATARCAASATAITASVNGYFLCDRGRYGYEFVNSERRFRRPLLKAGGTGDHVGISSDEALQQAAAWFSEGGTVIGIGSPRASLEEQLALARWWGKTISTPAWVAVSWPSWATS